MEDKRAVLVETAARFYMLHKGAKDDALRLGYYGDFYGVCLAVSIYEGAALTYIEVEAIKMAEKMTKDGVVI